jgi:hypothetical protein
LPSNFAALGSWIAPLCDLAQNRGRRLTRSVKRNPRRRPKRNAPLATGK